MLLQGNRYVRLTMYTDSFTLNMTCFRKEFDINLDISNGSSNDSSNIIVLHEKFPNTNFFLIQFYFV